jgi:signal transduction histidine kinase
MDADAPGLMCPHCQTSILASDPFCPGCGLDVATLTLALAQSAAIKAEVRLAAGAPEIPVARLGEVLLERKLLTEEQLSQALAYQREQSANGAGKMLGEVLVELKMASPAEIEAAIIDQVARLQSTLRQSNQLLADKVAERTAELQAAIARVKEVEQLKANFIANISHELRTPLTHMQGYILLMTGETFGPLNPRQSEALNAAVQSVEYLKQLIEDLIQFTVAARGEVAINSRTFSLTDLVRSVMNQAEAKIAERRVHLESRLPEAPVKALGDFEKLQWVLMQLIDNAIRFTPEGGRVTVSARPDIDRARIRLVVQDTGVGIPANRLPGLFDPQRLQAPGRSGLGLALVQRIVAGHGSEINVLSEEGKGSAFSFELPLA